MACFYSGTVQDFLAEIVDRVLARLAVGYANRGYTTQYSDQTLTWERDLQHLRGALEECVALSDSARLWGLLLEFSIPRKELRIDVVLLIRSSVVVIEAKTGSGGADAKRQIEEYAMLLHYFHKATSNSRVLSVIVSGDPVEKDFGRVPHLWRSLPKVGFHNSQPPKGFDSTPCIWLRQLITSLERAPLARARRAIILRC
jgi:hypothetical protein